VGILMLRSSVVAEEEESLTGLDFASNGDGCDERLEFTGAALINKFPATYMWKRTFVAQAGYYTTFFRGDVDGSLPDINTYYGAHPFPCDGNFDDENGQANGGTGDAGTTHYHEIAGNFVDYIANGDGSGTSVQVTKDGTTFYSQACTVEATGDNDLTITYYHDLSDITKKHSVALDNYRAAGSSQGLTYGGAPWNVEVECFSGVLRGIQNFEAVLTTGQLTAMAACDTNAEALSAASSNSLTHHYLNMNPTPADTDDASGSGNDPAWATADLPALWEE
jgi:hypothetical protein